MLCKHYYESQATFIVLLYLGGASKCVFQCGDCVFARGDSERSSLTADSMLIGEVEDGRTPEPLFSSEEEEEGKDTTMYF